MRGRASQTRLRSLPANTTEGASHGAQLLQGQVQQLRKMLIAVNGPGLMEMTRDLQGSEPMKQNPDDGGDLTSGAGSQQTGSLGLGNELADGGHGVVGGLLQPGVRLRNRGIPEDQLVVVGALDCVVDIGPATGAQPLSRSPVPLRTMTNPLCDLPQGPSRQGTHERSLVRVVTIGRRAGHAGSLTNGAQRHRLRSPVLKQRCSGVEDGGALLLRWSMTAPSGDVVGRGVDTVFRDVDGKVTRAYMFMGVN